MTSATPIIFAGKDNSSQEDTRPKPKATPRKEKSAPVRNPAFREHEGLKALQRELNRKK